MERILAALERRFGRFTFEGLTLFLVGAQAIAFVLVQFRPEVLSFLTLDLEAVRHGQVWRLVSYLFIPQNLSPIWVLFSLYILYLMGTSLESHWGPFRYQLFWLVGVVLTTAAAAFTPFPVTNQYLLMSLFLAFATLFPDHTFLLFFILPVKVKWLALVTAAYLVMGIASLPGLSKLVVVAAIATYLLFFGERLFALLTSERRFASRASERHRFHAEVEKPASIVPKVRRCAACGVTSQDDPELEFRVCTCAKHDGKPTEFCLPHARNH